MTNVSTVNFSQNLLEYLRDVAQNQQVILVGDANNGAVLLSAARYRELEQAAQDAAQKEGFFKEMEMGLAQVRAGYGIVKTLDELKAMEYEE